MQKENQTYKVAPADRLGGVSEYYFSKKLKEVARMNAEGKDVISLGIGSPDMPPSEQTIETLCNNAHDPNGHGYQPYVGIPELRKGFADWYKRWYGVELNPATEIQPLIGSKEGILHVTLAFVNPGEQVLVPNPGYPTYTSLSKILGAEVVNYNLKEEDGWMPDFDELEKMDLSRVKLMWTNYPNMPTGANATPELYERLVEFARRKNIVIVNDNPYSFILNDKPISILSVPGAKECCIEFNSMSKSHNMPGWRIGMLASNAEFVQWILKVKSNIDSGMFRAMQLAAAKALEADSTWYEGNNVNYRNRRHLAGEIMKTLGCTRRKASGHVSLGKNPRKLRRCRRTDRESAAGSTRLHHSGIYFREQRSEIHPHLSLLQRRQAGRSAGTNQINNEITTKRIRSIWNSNQSYCRAWKINARW